MLPCAVCNTEPLELVVISGEEPTKGRLILATTCLELHVAAMLAFGDGNLTDTAGAVIAPCAGRLRPGQSPFKWQPSVGGPHADLMNQLLVPLVMNRGNASTAAASHEADMVHRACQPVHSDKTNWASNWGLNWASGSSQQVACLQPLPRSIAVTVDSSSSSSITKWEAQGIDLAMKADGLRTFDDNFVPDMDVTFMYKWLPDQHLAGQKQRIMAFIRDKLLQHPELGGAFTIVGVNHANPQYLPTGIFPCQNRDVLLKGLQGYRGTADFLIIPTARSYTAHPSQQARYALMVIKINNGIDNEEDLANVMARARVHHYIYGSVSDGAILTVLTDLRSGDDVIFASHTSQPWSGLKVMEHCLSDIKALFDYLHRALMAVGPFSQ